MGAQPSNDAVGEGFRDLAAATGTETYRERAR